MIKKSKFETKNDTIGFFIICLIYSFLILVVIIAPIVAFFKFVFQIIKSILIFTFNAYPEHPTALPQDNWAMYDAIPKTFNYQPKKSSLYTYTKLSYEEVGKKNNCDREYTL